MTVQRFVQTYCPKIWFREEKVVFQLCSANIVFALVGVRQAQICDCACLKRKCMRGTEYKLYQIDTTLPTVHYDAAHNLDHFLAREEDLSPSLH